ncbi:MAG: ATP-binding protein [Muribaculaceae bacterium]|nr:ATP-binding protein [Muribaculaceae bacterium]
MNNYITEIHINKLFHLHNLTIQIADPSCYNIIITGKNGSGKTVLLRAMTKRLEYIFLSRDICLFDPSNSDENVELSFNDIESLISEYSIGSFIVASYPAARKTNIELPRNPTKPSINKRHDLRQSLSSQLLFFLSDLKIQEALARNENQIEDAERLNQWIMSFEEILKSIFNDSELELKFNYRDYSFKIHTQGKEFGFTEMSDGFVAILDIVADLILRMQPNGSITSNFNIPGIVLIDEVETHLHLQLQKEIMPLLTTLFPNIQFIVTTHSPFVLNSLPNATAYDLEHQEPISNLSEFSYQALTEGYFGVRTDSDYALKRYEELKCILEKQELSEAEKAVAKQLILDMRKIPEASAPELVGAYRQLEIEFFDKISVIGA